MPNPVPAAATGLPAASTRLPHHMAHTNARLDQIVALISKGPIATIAPKGETTTVAPLSPADRSVDRRAIASGDTPDPRGRYSAPNPCGMGKGITTTASPCAPVTLPRSGLTLVASQADGALYSS